MYHISFEHYSTVFALSTVESTSHKFQKLVLSLSSSQTFIEPHSHFLVLTNHTSRNICLDQISWRKVCCFSIYSILSCICLFNFPCNEKLHPKIQHHQSEPLNFFHTHKKYFQLYHFTFPTQSNLSIKISPWLKPNFHQSRDELSDFTVVSSCLGIPMFSGIFPWLNLLDVLFVLPHYSY